MKYNGSCDKSAFTVDGVLAIYKDAPILLDTNGRHKYYLRTRNDVI